MKKILAIIALSALLLALAVSAGCGETVMESGKRTTWNMANTDFSKLEVSHGFEVTIQHGSSYNVTINIDQRVLEYLVVDQRGDTLHIGLENGNTYVNTSQEAVITLPELEKLQLSGGSQAVVNTFSTGKTLELKLSGGSTAALDNLTVGDAKLSLSEGSDVSGVLNSGDSRFSGSGGSEFNLKGQAKHLEIDGSGGSRFNLYSFPIQTADINLDGASRAYLDIQDRLDINLSGGSVVNYTGEPRLGDINLSGGSTINQK